MKLFRKILFFVLAAFLFLLVILFFLLRLSLPRTHGEIQLNGIRESITIRRNHWGIPWIEARNRDDLFFAIGFLHASDRLFQMDMSRRMTWGRLSEIFGERTLDSDRYHKDWLIEESIKKTLENITAETEQLLQRYCDGVNAFINSRKLPPEFIVLNYRPEPWTIKDIGCIYKKMEILLAGSGSELYNAKVAEALGAEKAEKFISGSFGIAIINPEEYREIYENHNLRNAFLDEILHLENQIGSNNWVVSGDKSSSGRPILANDMHLPNLFPSFFYQIFATGDDFELSGCTFPGIPLIIFGRNQHIGWGFTNIGTDVIDYYVLEINPENPDQYLLDGNWKDFDTITQKIKIKNKKEIIHTIRLSRFGPVFEEVGRFLARHSAMLYPSSALDAFLEMDFSRNLDEFLEGAKKFSSPAQNLVFADIHGNIGYFPCGRIPMRKIGNGEIPLKATRGADIWEGFYDENQKPILLNPKKGYIVTANNPVIPENHLPLFVKKWDPDFRAERIDGLIRKKKKLSLEDNKKIQLDCFLMGAEFLVSRIQEFNFHEKKANSILDYFKKWDFKTETGVIPYLFYRFEYFLNQNAFSAHLRDKRFKNLISKSWIYRVLNYPAEETPSHDLSLWMDDPQTRKKENFKDVVEKSLVDTYDEYSQKSSKHNLTWKKLHRLYYQHPLGSISLFRKLLNRGPYPMPGGSGCILTASFQGKKGFDISHLSAFRMIMDFSDFSNSLFINSSGQSGHFLSPHYDDQIGLFVNSKYRKMEDFTTKLKILKLVPADR